jgi:hypothetical protein
MPDAMTQCFDFRLDGGVRGLRDGARPREAGRPGVADGDAWLAAARRAAVTRRADQAALAAAVRDLRSRGRLDYVR